MLNRKVSAETFNVLAQIYISAATWNTEDTKVAQVKYTSKDEWEENTIYTGTSKTFCLCCIVNCCWQLSFKLNINSQKKRQDNLPSTLPSPFKHVLQEQIYFSCDIFTETTMNYECTQEVLLACCLLMKKKLFLPRFFLWESVFFFTFFSLFLWVAKKREDKEKEQPFVSERRIKKGLSLTEGPAIRT